MDLTDYLRRISCGQRVLLAACDDGDVSDAEYEALRQATREQYEGDEDPTQEPT